jgi:hypothetical protein
MQKQSIWVIWIGALAAIFLGSGWIATIGRWTFGLMLVAHVVEFIVYRSLFQRAGGSMLHHFVQTLIYGLLHWTPIKQRLESEATSPPADS